MHGRHHLPLRIARRFLSGGRERQRAISAGIPAAGPFGSPELPLSSGHRRSFSRTTGNDNDTDNDTDDYEYDQSLDYDYDYDYGEPLSGPGTALVVGSSGCLGRAIAHHLSGDLGVRVIGADVRPPLEEDLPLLAGGFVELPSGDPWGDASGKTDPGAPPRPASLPDLTVALEEGLRELLPEGGLDALVCASGAWEGDPSGPEDALSQALVAERMLGANLYPVLAAGSVDGSFFASGGLFVALGATAALGGTPGMLGYGASKAAVHHALTTLGESTGRAVTGRSKRRATFKMRREKEHLRDLTVLGVLPSTIDTPANREAMPDQDASEWTKPGDLAKEIGLWLAEPSLRPHSGSLLKVRPSKNGTGADFLVAR